MPTMFRRRVRPAPFPEPYRPPLSHWLIMIAACIFFMWVR